MLTQIRRGSRFVKLVDILDRGVQYWHVTDPIPSDTYVRLAEQALSYDLGDPRCHDALAVVFDRGMDEGLVSDVGSFQEMAAWHHRSASVPGQTVSDLVDDLQSLGAEVVETRHGLDSSFVAVRVGERGASIDLFWDEDGRRVASVFTDEGAAQTFTTPGRELGREVVELLTEGGAR